MPVSTPSAVHPHQRVEGVAGVARNLDEIVGQDDVAEDGARTVLARSVALPIGVLARELRRSGQHVGELEFVLALAEDVAARRPRRAGRGQQQQDRGARAPWTAIRP